MKLNLRAAKGHNRIYTETGPFCFTETFYVKDAIVEHYVNIYVKDAIVEHYVNIYEKDAIVEHYVNISVKDALVMRRIFFLFSLHSREWASFTGRRLNCNNGSPILVRHVS